MTTSETDAATSIKTPEVQNGFNIRFRLSKAYRALETQDHVASKPSIIPHKPRRTTSENPLETNLEEFGENAHAFLWSDPSEKKKRRDDDMRNNLRDFLRQDVAGDPDEMQEEKRLRKMALEKQQRKISEQKKHGIDVDKYIRELNRNMPLTKKSLDKTRQCVSSGYFQAVRNVAVGHTKAMAPFRVEQIRQRRQVKDPEKAERLRLARERLKANSKYSGFWKKGKDNEKSKETKETEKRQKPKMAWCAADNSFMVQEWEEKKRKKEEVLSEKRRKRGILKKVVVSRSLSQKQSTTTPEKATSRQDSPVRQLKSPDNSARSSLSQEDAKTNTIFASIMENKSQPRSVATPSPGLSQSKQKQRPKTVTVKSSSISEEPEAGVLDEEEEKQEAKGKNEFASLLGSSSTVSEKGVSSKESSSSVIKALTRKPSLTKEGKKTAKTEESVKKVGTVNVKGWTRSRSGSTMAETKPLITCKYLYKMCCCKSISTGRSLEALKGQQSKPSGVIKVFGCPSLQSEAYTRQGLLCPFCRVFPGQKIRAWMKWNEIMADWESSSEDEEDNS